MDFTFVSHKPPMVTITAGLREVELKGHSKDTETSILREREFVVNIVNRSLLGPLHASSAEYPPGQSEVDALGLRTSESKAVRTPRLAAAPAALECRLHSTIELGKQSDRIVTGRVVMFQIASHLLKAGEIDTRELDPIARLGGPNYATFGDIVTTLPAAEVLTRRPQTPDPS